MTALGKFGKTIPMKPYKNSSGQSTVKAFQIYSDGVKVAFNDGSIYLYLREKTGREIVEKMKVLALAGEGLATYIGTLGDAAAEKLA